MHVTKIVQFDWSVVFESFCYKKLAPNTAAFYSVQLCHSYEEADRIATAYKVRYSCRTEPPKMPRLE